MRKGSSFTGTALHHRTLLVASLISFSNPSSCWVGITATDSTSTSVVCSDDVHDPLPLQLLQKYIAYARQYCHPALSEEGKHILAEHYRKLRQGSDMLDGAPVTVSHSLNAYTDSCIVTMCLTCCIRQTCQILLPLLLYAMPAHKTWLHMYALQARQLESLIRMGEARARLELAHTVTAEHAQVCLA